MYIYTEEVEDKEGVIFSHKRILTLTLTYTETHPKSYIRNKSQNNKFILVVNNSINRIWSFVKLRTFLSFLMFFCLLCLYMENSDRKKRKLGEWKFKIDHLASDGVEICWMKTLATDWRYTEDLILDWMFVIFFYFSFRSVFDFKNPSAVHTDSILYDIKSVKLW